MWGVEGFLRSPDRRGGPQGSPNILRLASRRRTGSGGPPSGPGYGSPVGLASPGTSLQGEAPLPSPRIRPIRSERPISAKLPHKTKTLLPRRQDFTSASEHFSISVYMCYSIIYTSYGTCHVRARRDAGGPAPPLAGAMAGCSDLVPLRGTPVRLTVPHPPCGDEARSTRFFSTFSRVSY